MRKGRDGENLKNPKWPPGGPKWPTGSGKESNPRLLAFFDLSTPSMRKGRDGENGEKKQ